MSRRALTAALACLVAAGFALAPGSHRAARADVPERASYDFDNDPLGFNAVSYKDNNFGPDASATVKISHAKGEFKSGVGALAYSYKVEAGGVRALIAEAKPPQTARSLRFWLRSTNPTAVILSLREDDGSEYQLPVYAQAYEWTPVAVNVDELALGDNSTDENGKVDLVQVNSISILDVASMLVSMPGDLGKALGAKLLGDRTLWLDDLQFSNDTAPRTSGPYQAGGKKSFIVDNFDNGTPSWIPALITLTDQPVFDIFPINAKVSVLNEAAGPGKAATPVEPGGKGLRLSYKRGEREVYALLRSVEKRDLTGAERLRFNINLSAKSSVIVQLKEKGGAEYQYTLDPETSVGWRDVNLALSDFSLSQNSKDENGQLDPAQIKEVSLLDASAFLGLPGGDVTLELDAVRFELK